MIFFGAKIFHLLYSQFTKFWSSCKMLIMKSNFSGNRFRSLCLVGGDIEEV